jgi:hypothetical protein
VVKRLSAACVSRPKGLTRLTNTLKMTPVKRLSGVARQSGRITVKVLVQRCGRTALAGSWCADD